jgi:hypothetical protein
VRLRLLRANSAASSDRVVSACIAVVNAFSTHTELYTVGAAGATGGGLSGGLSGGIPASLSVVGCTILEATLAEQAETCVQRALHYSTAHVQILSKLSWSADSLLSHWQCMSQLGETWPTESQLARGLLANGRQTGASAAARRCFD